MARGRREQAQRRAGLVTDAARLVDPPGEPYDRAVGHEGGEVQDGLRRDAREQGFRDLVVHLFIYLLELVIARFSPADKWIYSCGLFED